MPKANQLRVDKLLSNISVKYRNTSLIAKEMFPMVTVKKRSDLYRIYDRDFRLPQTDRAVGAISRTHDFNVSTASYVLEKHALHEIIPDDDFDNYEPHDLRADTTEELTDKILLRMEQSAAILMTNTSWSQNTSLSAAQKFSLDTVTSNPVPIFDTATTIVLENTSTA